MATSRTVKEGRTTSMTERIVETVAEREGVDPLELSPPLFDAVDPEAMADLVADPTTGDPRQGVRLTFSYCGYDITVEGSDLQVTAQ